MGNPDNLIYVDLDGTLIYSEPDPETGETGPISVRPGTAEFLSRLAELGPVILLTHGTRPHAEKALEAIGPAADFFDRVLTREDLQPVIDQLKAIDSTPRLRNRDRLLLYRRIMPIAPPGFMIDDWEVGSWMFWLKSRALRIGPERWIQIRAYEPRVTRGTGLEEAYRELVKRLKGRARRFA